MRWARGLFPIFVPVLVIVVVSQVAASIAAGTVYYRAALVAGPLVLGVFTLALARSVGIARQQAAILLGGCLLAGLYGFWLEWNRWNDGGLYTAGIVLANLDIPLLCVSALAVLVPLSPLLPGLSIPWPAGGRSARNPKPFGSAEWMSLTDAERVLSGGKLVVGEAYSTDGRHGRPGSAPLLTYAGDGHLLTVGGSGSGKTTSVVIPNCLTWSGPLVVLDPKGDLSKLCGGARRAMGHDVLVLNPHDVTSDAINVLDWLDPSSDQVVLEAEAVVGWLFEDGASSSKDMTFVGQAKSLIHGVLLDLVCDTDLSPNERTLGALHARLAPNAIGLTLSAMEGRDPAYGYGVPHQVGHAMNEQRINAPESFEGTLIFVNNAVGFLKAGGASRMLSGVGNRTAGSADILTRDLDIFLAIPLRTLSASPAIGRLVLGALLNTLYRQFEHTAVVDRQVLFLLDEMPRLGNMPLLEVARDAGRGAGIRLWGIVQDFGQLRKAYGDAGLTSWLANSAVQTFIGINDPDTARWLADRIGQTTLTVSSTGSSRSGGPTGWVTTQRGTTSNTSLAGGYLMTPDEIMNMGVDAQGLPDEQIVLVRQQRPVRCGVAKYYRRQDFLSRL